MKRNLSLFIPFTSFVPTDNLTARVFSFKRELESIKDGQRKLHKVQLKHGSVSANKICASHTYWNGI